MTKPVDSEPLTNLPSHSQGTNGQATRINRRAESVLVLIMRCDGQTLMLERCGWPGFWQSVTGGIEWNEDQDDAAARELLEETGLYPTRLQTRGVQRQFEIFPQYRHKYPADIRFNREHEYIAHVDLDCSVRLDPSEHVAYRWVSIPEAISMCLSWSNRLALRNYYWESQ